MDITVFEVTAVLGRKGTWAVTLGDETLTVASVEGDDSFVISKEETARKIELQKLMFAPHLIIKIDKKQIAFKLDKPNMASLQQWLGPPTIQDLKVALARRLRWCLSMGILFVVTSIPLSADPQSGMEAVPFNLVSALLGASLIAIVIIARFWQHRILFLLDGIWFSLLAIDVAVDIFHGRSIWWFIIVLLLIQAAVAGFSEYKRFAHMSTVTN